MIRSMTGYGQGFTEVEGIRFQADARSVNHRFLDLRLRLPPAFQLCEKEARGHVRSDFKRGRVEISVNLVRDESAGRGLTSDETLVRSILEASTELKNRFGLSGELDLATLLRVPGVLKEQVEVAVPGDEEKSALLRSVELAVQALDKDRAREGQTLQTEIHSRLNGMAGTVREISELAGKVPEEGRKKLLARLEKLAEGTELDPVRLAQEATILADRSDVTEEIVRLRSHIAQAAGLLETPDGDPVGKRLDFLLQEINRETNTINSKSSNLAISQLAMVMKTEGEKVREQLQNLE
jgi:uncharacterized protein (TIGR00255 family)